MTCKCEDVHGSPPRAWGKRSNSVRPNRHRRFTPTCVGKTWPQPTVHPCLPVHPHVRGENHQITTYETNAFGSPPRAWGKQLSIVAAKRLFRFTPTCVGKTAWVVFGLVVESVHPHVRGENKAGEQYGAALFGSPPRAWGKLSWLLSGSGIRRFTPTCVGKTARMAFWKLFPSVHPHVRGENPALAASAVAKSGSPPRAWGKPLAFIGALYVRRFTPTCVGKTRCVPCGSCPPAVHPHVRGENWIRQRIQLGDYWFTPTCVGKTPQMSTFSRCPLVHPHVRGENRATLRSSRDCIGSPPRAWGKQIVVVAAEKPSRFTPTCVGKTSASANALASASVHPHVRGENSVCYFPDYTQFGSPPRAWGKRLGRETSPSVPRFTPTCVGKTFA